MEFYGLCTKVLVTFKTTYGVKWNYMDQTSRLQWLLKPHMGCLDNGPYSKVVMTFKSTYGMSRCVMECYGPNNKVVMTFMSTHGMSNGIIWIRQQGCNDL